jgi:beta-ureidopropionase / N-carbamoyl-L-amino-acid hydrolase
MTSNRISGQIQTDGDRLWRSLMQMAEIGATSDGGSERLALTDEDQAALELFEGWARAEGCQVSRDPVGNSFAERPGTDPERPPVLVGSHLDTQPRGGRFDGPLGTLAALEIVRTLNEHDIRTIAPVIAVSWANEEGARFPLPSTGAGVFAQLLDFDRAMNQRSYDGPTFGEELDRLGRTGSADMDSREFAAYFELHIEQGPVLEAAGNLIGVVDRGQGVRGIAVTLTGTDSHAGTTPLAARRDALIGAAQLVITVRDLAQRTPGALATVSRLEVTPGSRAVIPGRADLIADLRHSDPDMLDLLEAAVRRETAAIATEASLEVSMNTFIDIPPVAFEHSCVEAVERAATCLGYPAMRIVSGAAHDAFPISRRIPTAMVFIPCRNGVSHHPSEYAEPDHARAGADVLLHAVLQAAHTST